MHKSRLTLCILMDFPIHVHINTKYHGLPILYFKGLQVDVSMFRNYNVFLSLKVVLILANSTDSDEMQQYAAFHLGLHCLQL